MFPSPDISILAGNARAGIAGWQRFSSTAFLYNIADAGAKSGGLIDNSRAIQRLMYDVASDGGGAILIPRGRWLVEDRLFIPSNIELVGQGWGSVLVFNWTLASDGSTYIVNDDQVNGNSGIRLDNFTIEGAGDGLPGVLAPTQAGMLLLRRGQDVQITRMKFYRAPAISCAIQGVSHALIANNFVYQSGRDGIACRTFESTEATEVVIANNVVREVGDDAIAISGESSVGFAAIVPTNITVNGNVIFGAVADNANGSGRGIMVLGGDNISIVGNSIADTFDHSIYLQGIDSTPMSVQRVTVVGNTCLRAGLFTGTGTTVRRGIGVLGPANNIVIAENVVQEAWKSSIRITDNSEADRPVTDVEIRNNVVIDGAQSNIVTDYGIYITSGVAGNVSRIRVTGNRVVNNNGGGIRQQTATDVIIENNVCVNNGNATTGATDTNASGIICTGDGAAPTVIVRGNRCYDTRGGAATQSYGIVFATTAGAVADATVEFNILYGNRTASLQINQAPTLIHRRGNRLSSDASRGRAVLVNGTVTVNTAEVIAADNIILSKVVGAGTTRGDLEVGTITAGTSFVINARSDAAAISADDDSTVFWEIVH